MLVLINGAPGVGKSTLAQRYADDHPLALIIDIDAIRTSLGQWATLEESRLVARDLALALAGTHVRNGHDVIVPQYLGRPEFRDQLELLTTEADATFVEVVLTDDVDRITQRFRARRTEYARTGEVHPEGDLGDEAIDSEVQRANEELLRDASSRDAFVISASAGIDASYRELRNTLASQH